MLKKTNRSNLAMIIEFLIGQLFLALFNITNSHIDAHRILDNKTIAHGVNFAAYALAVAIICFLLSIPFGWPIVLFALSAFFNRQFSFDIPLNLRRGLAWDYQSTANPPKAILDRIERFIFGDGANVGRFIFKVYLTCYCIITTIWVWTT